MRVTSPALTKPGKSATARPSLFRCDHCGSPFQKRFEEERFCCAGCRTVFELIQDGGFGSFYELLGRRTLEPVSQLVPAEDASGDLAEAVEEAEEKSRNLESPATLTLRVGNLSCTACVWLIDHLFQKYPGALKLVTDTSRSVLSLWWTPGEFDIHSFLGELRRFGYPADLYSCDDSGPVSESHSLLTRVGVTGGLALNTMAFTLPSYLGLAAGTDLSRLFTLVAFASASLSVAVGGSYFFQRAIASLRAGALHMDVPIALGLAIAYLGSVAGWFFQWEGLLYFDFVATFAFFMLAGRWLHLRVLDRNRSQLHARGRNLTTVTRLNPESGKSKIPYAEVVEWDALEITRGAMVPTRSLLVETDAVFLLDWITGEPEPVTFRCGQEIPAGARSASDQSVQVVSCEPFSGSFLESLLEMAPASAEAGEEVRSSGRVAGIYMAVVIAISFFGALARGVILQDPVAAVQVLVSVLVVSCPCALGLALPLLNERFLARLREKGVYVRRHSLWSRLLKVRRIAFDKTGTLTGSIHRLREPGIIDSLTPEAREALRLLTEKNEHPHAKAIFEELSLREGLLVPTAGATVEFSVGQGAGCRTGDDLWRLGRRDWACPGPLSAHAQERGCTLSKNGVTVASFEIAESIRDGAVRQIQNLRARGLDLMVISGDPEGERVLRIARELGLEEEKVFFNQSPEAKAALIRERSPETTLYVGDGGNDRLALKTASVSGSPATGIRAIEGETDFVFTGRGFHVLTLLLETARRRRNLIRVLFTVAILYNAIAIAVCLAGMMNPILAAVLMPLSSIVTSMIATRGSAL
jgi:P-type Cu2+ transporter